MLLRRDTTFAALFLSPRGQKILKQARAKLEKITIG